MVWSSTSKRAQKGQSGKVARISRKYLTPFGFIKLDRQCILLQVESLVMNDSSSQQSTHQLKTFQASQPYMKILILGDFTLAPRSKIKGNV